MDIKNRILKIAEEKGQVKTAQIMKETSFSRAYINRFFQELCQTGELIRLGEKRGSYYVLANKESLVKAKRKVLGYQRFDRLENIVSEDVLLEEIKQRTGIFEDLSKNVSNILDYAFTEMLNNSLEHSESNDIEITFSKRDVFIIFNIRDRGVGIFRNIMQKNDLHSEMEAIQLLLKGKQTTMPEAHSGEGIFFTSKVADMLIINSFGKKLSFSNILEDVFVEDSKSLKGTRVTFSIRINSKKELLEIFHEYTDDSFEFSKTKVLIKLYKEGTEYISRSQARRLVTGLDKFKIIVLDFEDVETVGQGFADEVFRVWQNKYPKINIQAVNTNENIQFMIDRAIP